MYITKFIKSKWKSKKNSSYGMIGKIDGEHLSKEIESILNDFEKEKIELIKIFPINSGKYSPNFDKAYGFGYTDGIIIIGKNNE